MTQAQINGEKKLVIHLTVGGSIIGLLLFTYILFIISDVFVANPDNGPFLIQLHRAHPALFIAWIIPISLTILVNYFAKYYLRKKREADASVEVKNTIIAKNAMFAKSIGEGDFDNSEISELNKNDLLTRSLLLMRENLIRNKHKEEITKWINEGKELVSDVLRKNNDFEKLSYEVLVALLKYTNIIQGNFYLFNEENRKLENIASYAFNRKKYTNQSFCIGQGLVGTSAYEKLPIYRTAIPDYYATVTSGLIGDKKPGSIFIVPLYSEENLQGVIEFADISDEIEAHKRELIEVSAPIIGQIVFNLKINSRTEKLLAEAQSLAEELRENEEELQQNAEEMRMTQEELEKSNNELERQITEVESSKTRLHSLLENAAEVISIFDEKGIVLYESPSTEKILGYTPEEVVGSKGIKRVAPEHVELVLENFNKLLHNPHRIVNYTFRHKHKNGEEVWVETTGRNMLSNSAINGIIFNTRDITLQRLAEKERRIKGQMQALSENSPDLIIRFGLNGKFLYTNPMIKKYFNLSANELIDKVLTETEVDSDIADYFMILIETAQVEKTIREEEFEFETPIGLRIMEINVIPEFNEEKELETILIVGHDITEIKEIEKEVKDKNLKLTESINYAQRIQTAILPDKNVLNNYFKDSFVFYQARDLVSGDFPWYKKVGDYVFTAAVDCTGHGVPGALLSFIGYFLLNDIVKFNSNLNAAELLDIFDKEVKKTLRQDGHTVESRDGMDIAFCKFNLIENTMEFAGAHRPLYLLRNNELLEFKGDRKSVGGIYGHKEKQQVFTNHSVDLKSKDKIFIFSDGLPDQFSIEKQQKFQTSRIKNLIETNASLNMDEFHTFFVQSFNEWKGKGRQIDDILLMGVEI